MERGGTIVGVGNNRRGGGGSFKREMMVLGEWYRRRVLVHWDSSNGS